MDHLTVAPLGIIGRSSFRRWDDDEETRVIRKLAILAALTLGACHPAADDANKAFPVSANPARGVPNEQPPHRSDVIKQSKMIPTALQGRWGLAPNDCDISRSDTRGLLVVAKDRLDFYTSKATVDALSKASQYEVTADLTFTEDGKTWQRREHLQAALGDTRLLRTEESPRRTFQYVRC
jgi:hypothetical protein